VPTVNEVFCLLKGMWKATTKVYPVLPAQESQHQPADPTKNCAAA